MGIAKHGNKGRIVSEGLFYDSCVQNELRCESQENNVTLSCNVKMKERYCSQMY